MIGFAAAQNDFHCALERVVNASPAGRADLLRSMLRPKTWYQKRAADLARRYRSLNQESHLAREISADEQDSTSIPVVPYSGECHHVHAMSAYLGEHLSDDLYAAFVHGSLGSYEEMSYSDFDALVIIKDEVMRDQTRLARVARDLHRAIGIMVDYDPLQHHGWFVLTELDLRYYCEAYFPSVLFRYSKALLPDQPGTINLRPRDAHREMKHAFLSLSSTVLRQLKRKNYPTTVYGLKSLLSRFMLLPALYVQVRDGEGVWKADSFDKARTDFSAAAWSSMEIASRIRLNWQYDLSGLRRYFLTRGGAIGTMLRRKASPPIPPSIARLLSVEVFASMEDLVRAMRSNLEKVTASAVSQPA